MFTKLRRTAPRAMMVAVLLPMASQLACADETIDAFARAHLKSSQEALDAKRTSDTAEAPAPAKPATPEVPPELLFIHAVENTTVAYLRVDGRYGYSVSAGDRFGDWRVVNIGSDFVDVTRAGKPRRLLLPNAVTESRAGLAPPGRRDGDVY
ncbi:hypothetical protein [Pandoraea sp. NPDC087047]|uniref:hypothetical protein n=1 Tax=Pandoraea sp. NPDC087047 TaxID=3364390 RepID=UPI00382280B3